jgi:hypothetical protein
VDIFIDESGAFLPAPPARPRFCAVTAVTLRSRLVPQFEERLRTLRAAWGVDSAEVKGSALNERQMAEALRTFDAYDMTAFAAVLDTGMHPPELIHAYRRETEQTMLRGLTPEHNENARIFVADLVARLKALSDQLALQIYTTMVPIERLIREMPTYYALRSPSEVGTFRWTLDAKGDKGVTESETFWRRLVCPHLQTTFITEPAMSVKGLDYSAYDESFCSTYTELPEYLRVRLPPGRELLKGRVTDLRKMMLESLRFEPSHSSAGLQAADIVGSALTRALNGTLQVEGWRDLGRLFIRRSRHPPVDLIQFSLPDETEQVPARESVMHVLRTLNGSAKSMHPPRR